MTRSRLLVLAVLALLVAAFFALDLDRHLSLEALRGRQEALQALVATHPFASAAVYFGIYVLVTALSLPGAAVMTLAGGAVFGLVWGTVLVSFASTVGATLAFLVARFLLREAVQRRFGDRLAAVNAGIERDGAFYLFSLRLVPAFPFFVINLLMALTPIRARTFYWASQLGMLPGTVVYVNAGTQLAGLRSPGDILSPGLLLSFTALALFPLAARWALRALRRGGAVPS
ncbi:TVP38/TMEM64 family protein [Inmirania thermothiophila]|uniref:TVP38/TMEM64 family membrane protein n=1 Tax=Inmirania thermothiophila TaxID=1750597 RepID=A0A3N1Y9Z5_9GAMM|nr:TVP38/TMEM64 family protein [Inmirania thermothiophila]ROR34442.1 putative membrane protein YdjX (TVP38/TMEM64 family) [Inmirania thermothiophila]